MKDANACRLRARRAHIILGSVLFALCALPAPAATWHGLEPLKSRRTDVERELGRPVAPASVPELLRFKVAGGLVTVTFVTAKFVATKKLAPAYEGTMLEVVLQHDNAADTPDSLGLLKNGDFQREERSGVAVFRNRKDGISYTFVNNRLRTTRYAPAAEALVRAQRGTTGKDE